MPEKSSCHSTTDGERYAAAITAVIDELSRSLAARVDPGALRAADHVLRAVLASAEERGQAARLVTPPH